MGRGIGGGGGNGDSGGRMEGRKQGGPLTPPAPSRIASTNPLRLPRYASHFAYRVARLTPSCSTLYASVQSSTSCSRAGTSSRISSASARVRICADTAVLACMPRRVRGVRGGGWNGDALRWGGV